MIPLPKNIIKKDNKIYEQVCSISKGRYSTYEQSDIKFKYTGGAYPPYTYTTEMLERSIKIQAAKKIQEKNKAIDRYERYVKNIIKGRKELDFEDFIYNSIYNYIDNKKTKNEEINQLVSNSI